MVNQFYIYCVDRGSEALDNGVLRCGDPKKLQAICDGPSAEEIDAFLRKWLRLLPHPCTAADHKAGYRYQVSILQTEFSLTQVLNPPVIGRVFFEELIRENPDLGRPSQVKLIFDRRVGKKTAGRCASGLRNRVRRGRGSSSR
jgi:hypothetical protein